MHYLEVCSPSERNKTKQVIYIKKSKGNGKNVADKMHAKLAAKIDQKNDRRKRRGAA